MSLIKALFALALTANNGAFSVSAFSPAHPVTRSTCRPESGLNAIQSPNPSDDDMNNSPSLMARREILSKIAGATIFSIGLATTSTTAANAFPNKISSQYDDRPKQRGAKPKGLGLGKRIDLGGEEYTGLKQCGAAPNCFCSTDPLEDDPDHNIPSWRYPSDLLSSKEDAFQQLYEVVKAYLPGQNNIDGGGFDIVTFDPKAGYMYVQFESLKNGFIDDVEFAVIDDKKNQVEVRSSSRLGYLDFGVNAKRLNYIAKALRAKGWDAPGVELETHRGYAEENGVKQF